MITVIGIDCNFLFIENNLMKEGGFMPAKGQKSGYTIECENCKKMIYQTKTQYKRAKHHFCSNKCQMEYQHKEKYEFRMCPICKNKFEIKKSSTQTFCSIRCQNEWQKTRIGKSNPKYNRIEIKCENCGKEYIVKNYKTQNNQHNFCSNTCRREWYSKVFSQSLEWKNESRKRAVRILSEGKIPFTNSSCQLIVNQILNDINIKFISEYPCKYYSIDNYLLDYNLMIEVQGDFWHCNPLKYNQINQTVQVKRIPKDKAKHTYIKNKYNIEILYLWETDINNNVELCKKLIQKYILNNGHLKNYHSFNYYLDDENQLCLNDPLITPYQDMTNEELKKYKIA